MRRTLALTVVAVIGLAGSACSTKGPARVLGDIQFAGNMARSPSIPAGGPFRVAYSWNCAKQVSRGENPKGGFAYTLLHADDETIAAEHPRVDRSGLKGKGTVSYRRQGNYYFSVNATCDWRIKVTAVRS